MTDYSLESPFVQQLDADIVDFIHKGIDLSDEINFNKLAVAEFEYQFNVNDIYREYCTRKNVTPESISSWDEIPAVPSQAFKEHIIASFPLEKTELSYMTGGTTTKKRAKIFRDKSAVELIFEANKQCTRSFLFPDVEKMKILFMVPSPKIAPTMGMAVGLEQVRRNFGTEDSEFLITPRGLNIDLLFRSLRGAEDSGEPIALIGATSGFVYFFNACEKEGISFELPKGSRISDGGGYSGKFGECSRNEYHQKCEQILGIPQNHCVNTYGTGESSTNYFDNVLQNHVSSKDEPRFKISPPWTRTIAVDTKTFERLPEGEIGLLRHCDLANRAMVIKVQTDNLGYETKNGFEIIGRAGVKEGEIKTTPIDNMVGQMAEHRMGRFIDSFLHSLIKWQVPRRAKKYKKTKVM
ncbi:MAG: hypothetical protein Q7J10_07240 [Methanosarcinaceae archaeon]|nr:hypothetical protein [Methanosarcinaceae archaeon]